MALSIKEAVGTMATVGKAVHGEVRAALLEQLRRKPQNVTALSESIKQKQPLVSHHLGLMAAAGVLNKQRDGKSVLYAVNGATFAKLAKCVELLSNAPDLPKVEDADEAEAETADEAEAETADEAADSEA